MNALCLTHQHMGDIITRNRLNTIASSQVPERADVDIKTEDSFLVFKGDNNK